MSSGVSPIGPIYKGASVRVVRDNCSTYSTWLTARREGSMETLDGESILHDIENVASFPLVIMVLTVFYLCCLRFLFTVYYQNLLKVLVSIVTNLHGYSTKVIACMYLKSI